MTLLALYLRVTVWETPTDKIPNTWKCSRGYIFSVGFSIIYKWTRLVKHGRREHPPERKKKMKPTFMLAENENEKKKNKKVKQKMTMNKMKLKMKRKTQGVQDSRGVGVVAASI